MSADPPSGDREPDDAVAPDETPSERPEPVAIAEARRALRQIHREAIKAGFVYALVDGVLTVTVTTGVLTVVEVDAIPSSVPVPPPIAGIVADLLSVPVETVAVGGSVLVAAAVGLLVWAVEFWWIARRTYVEWFERKNPGTMEALRTARDASEDDLDDRMARELYADVLERLRDASGARLVDGRRIAARLLVVFLVGLVASQAALVGVTFDLPDQLPVIGGNGGGNGGGTTTPGPGGDGGSGGETGGLSPGDAVLGEPEDVNPGSVDIPVEIDTGGVGDERTDSPYESGGFPSESADVEAQEAGFAPPEQLEDADLIREYNLRIRGVDGNESVGSPAVTTSASDGSTDIVRSGSKTPLRRWSNG